MKHTLLAAAALALGLGPAAAQDIQDRVIRFGYGLNEDSVQGRAVDLQGGLGGRLGQHSEQFQPMWEEMTQLFRDHPGATW